MTLLLITIAATAIVGAGALATASVAWPITTTKGALIAHGRMVGRATGGSVWEEGGLGGDLTLAGKTKLHVDELFAGICEVV